MRTKRSYRDSCGIARALDAVGERWALLVVRELLLGSKRFTDLRAALPGISTDVLALRLRELEATDVVRRATLPPPAAAKVYELTTRGRELEPVLLALGRWGSREPLAPGVRPLGLDAFVIALPTLFDAAGAADAATTIELRLGADRVTARVADGRLDVARGAAGDPDARIAGDPAVLTEVLWHGRPLAAAEAEGALRIDGDRAAAERFLGLFPPPRPAASSTGGRS
jgi:DNA-binding HxlR family transcriptional regulator